MASERLIEAARYLASMNDAYENSGDVMTNLKLQKLLYYAQGYHLAFFNQPLFDDDFVAWQYGPVVPSLYRQLKPYLDKEVKIEYSGTPDIFSEEQKNLLRDIFEQFGQFSAWKLVEMTHNEAPWKSTKSNETITKEKMRQYFLSRI